VVLDHVAQGAGLLVIAAPLVHAVGLADGQLHVVNGVAMPQALEKGVREPEHQDVLDGFLSQIMVYPEDLGFGGEAGEIAVERLGGGEVVAERFFHDNALPTPRRAVGGVVALQQPGAVQVFSGEAELAGGYGEVAHEVAAQGGIAGSRQELLQAGIGDWISQISLTIEQVPGKRRPHLLVHRLGARELFKRLPKFGAPGLGGLLPPGEANHPEFGWKKFLLEVVVKGGDELTERQVPAGPENHHRAGFHRPARLAQTANLRFFHPFRNHLETMDGTVQNFNL